MIKFNLTFISISVNMFCMSEIRRDYNNGPSRLRINTRRAVALGSALLLIGGGTKAIAEVFNPNNQESNPCLDGSRSTVDVTPGKNAEISTWGIGNGSSEEGGFPGIVGATANPSSLRAAVERLNPGVDASALPDNRPLEFPADCVGGDGPGLEAVQDWAKLQS